MAGARSINRRAVLLGGAGFAAAIVAGGALVENDVLPGRVRFHDLLGLNGSDGAIPDRDAGPRIDGSFVSRHRRAETGWSVSYPPGSTVGTHLPVIVSLHGKGGTHRSSFDTLGLDRFLADAVARGAQPFAIASVDGGDSYWHRRRDGSDSGAMVLEEFVPMLAEQGLDTARLGLFGWSMGGYGALLLAGGSGPSRVRAVGTLSAALWTEPGDSAPGAFDGPEDFARHDVFVQRPRLQGLPLRMDCGDGDPFAAANRSYRAGLPDPAAGGFQPGAHTEGYWRRMVPDQLAFLGRHLTR